MRISLTCILLMISCLCRAGDDKEALKKLLAYPDAFINSGAAYHIRYDMTITGGAKNAERQGSITVDYYSKGSKKRMVMGDKQELMLKDNIMLTANHEMQLITIAADTTVTRGKTGSQVIAEFSSWLDEDTRVQRFSCDHPQCFRVTFQDHEHYSTMELHFGKGKKALPLKIRGTFLAKYQRYDTMTINYKSWDKKWKAPGDFPGFGKYVVRRDKRFKKRDQWNNYQFYQPKILPEK